MANVLQFLTLRVQGHTQFLSTLVMGGGLAIAYYGMLPLEAGEQVPPDDPVKTAAIPQSIQKIDSLIDAQVEMKDSLVPNPPEVEATTEIAEPLPISEQTPPQLVKFYIQLLEQGLARLDQVDHYSARFFKQERIDGEMLKAQEMDLRLRQSPFSVYMKWVVGDRGRELLYVDGQNENRMLIRLGGFKGRLIPTLRIDPNSDRARSESRHPVTSAGLYNLTRKLLDARERDLIAGVQPTIKIMENQKFDDRECYQVEIEYQQQKHSETYRKTIVTMDSELSLPIAVKNYTWPNEFTGDDENETLIEHYSYHDLQLDVQLADAAFQKDNPKYRFK